MQFEFAGFGVITDKVIEEGDVITFYTGDYLDADPGTSHDDYVFELEHKRKLFW